MHYRQSNLPVEGQINDFNKDLQQRQREEGIMYDLYD